MRNFAFYFLYLIVTGWAQVVDYVKKKMYSLTIKISMNEYHHVQGWIILRQQSAGKLYFQF